MNPLQKLNDFGQSVWYDNIQRKQILSGELAEMISKGEIRGITSNPSIFNAAISKSNDYDSVLQPLAWAGWSPEAVFWQIAIDDIKAATEMFLDVYEKSGKIDGYVSLEVSPLLAFDAEKTLADAKALWKRVSVPNLMIKIPATKEGVVAIRKAIAEGINVNATLIFSLDRYAEVIDAYLSGLEDRIAAGQPIHEISSVASFFVSRVDSKIDGNLQSMVNAGEISEEEGRRLQGKAAIANARLAYRLFEDSLQAARFKAIQEKGGRAQRPLWASTSTKNPAYRDVLYVEELIGKRSVNTIPPSTLAAFRDHGKVENKIDCDLEEAEKIIRDLSDVGIEMDVVTDQLEVEGVQAFAEAYKELISTIRQRSVEFQKGVQSLEKLHKASLARMIDRKTIDSLFAGDPVPWVKDEAGQKEFKQRLGWLDAPQKTKTELKSYEEFREEILKDGFEKALVIGMGGSSLAPEVFSILSSQMQENKKKGVILGILDSTDPDSVRKAEKAYPVKNTLYIISSKSGSTTEVSANFHYFWGLAAKKFGDQAGSRFIAITDPGTSLEELGKERKFRKIFNADPEVGGRFSALTAFGLIPATLVGFDSEELLKRAGAMRSSCLPGGINEMNPGLALGTLIGTAASAGRDKLTLIADPEIECFGSWLEQLIAESTGKQGKGILPVDLEPEVHPEKYGNDRLFVYLCSSGRKEQRFTELISAGLTGVTIPMPEIIDIGAEMYRWEVATAVACAVLEINPFDQPDVQASKSITKKMIQEYQRSGSLPEEEVTWQSFGIEVFNHGSPIRGKNLHSILEDFLAQAKKGNYVAINAFFPRDEEAIHELQELRKKIINQTGLAVTLGFGPRFLHSTGQYHKGGPNTGYFLVLTHSNKGEDIEIPEDQITFGILEKAQALGDSQALQEKGRKVLRIQIAKSQIKDLL